MNQGESENSYSPVSFETPWLDVANELLWRGSKTIRLRPKAFALLRYLVEHRGRLVTKEELLDSLWHDRYVCEDALAQAVLEVRNALGDEAKAPQFIETVHGRGYRFIGKISLQRTNSESQKREAADGRRQLVGRELELAQLQHLLERVLGGERQVVFVTGEPGIGKTSLVNAFLHMLAPTIESGATNPQSQLWVVQSQCLQSHGSSEAFMPVLEALTGLYRDPSCAHLVPILRQHAPLWLTQMPSLCSTADLEMLQRVTAGATRERMLREIAEALEALTADAPLVLVLEDLHWSDYSTLDLISCLAQRRAPARLLLIGTYRPAEATHNRHPLRAIKQELLLHGQCQELPLTFLNEAAVNEYLMGRFPGNKFTEGLAQWTHRRTDGNPLFMVSLIDQMEAQRLITWRNENWIVSAALDEMGQLVPATIKQMVEREFERCSREEQRVLEAASVAGMKFCTAAVAAAVDQETAQIEFCCESLAQRNQFLRSASVCRSPDGQLIPHYEFLHALYQDAFYQQLPEISRARLHRRLGEYIERTQGNLSLGDKAVNLARHFEMAREYGRAIKYYQHAVENSIRRYAKHETAELARRGLQLLNMVENSPECIDQELNLQIALGIALMVTEGPGTVNARRAFTRAYELCQQTGRTSTLLFSALFGLWRCCINQEEFGEARKLAAQLLLLAEKEQDTTLRGHAHRAMGLTLEILGEYAPALEHLEKGIELRSQQPAGHPFLYYIEDSGAGSQCTIAMIKCALGYPDQALTIVEEAITLAKEFRYPETLAFAYCYAAHVHWERRESKQVLERMEKALALICQHGFPHEVFHGKALLGWALGKQGQVYEGIEQIRQILLAHGAAEFKREKAFFSVLLAELMSDAGRAKEASIIFEEAIGALRGTEVGQALNGDIYRRKGELLLQESTTNHWVSATNHRQSAASNSQLQEAEACFYQAIEVARRQVAKSHELRATMSLARLLQKQNRQAEARQKLSEIYNWFTEGHDTPDLLNARELLKELS